MISAMTHTNQPTNHPSRLDSALKFLVGFDLFDVIARAVVKALTDLRSKSGLRQHVPIQARSRERHLLLHGLPDLHHACTTALHPSGERITQPGVLFSQGVDLISEASNHLLTKSRKSLL